MTQPLAKSDNNDGDDLGLYRERYIPLQVRERANSHASVSRGVDNFCCKLAKLHAMTQVVA
jgi:hypothetical protein